MNQSFIFAVKSGGNNFNGKHGEREDKGEESAINILIIEIISSGSSKGNKQF